MTEKPKLPLRLPPRLPRTVSRYDHYGNPRPEWEINAATARHTADQGWARLEEWLRRVALDAPWSVRRKRYGSDWRAIYATLVALLGAVGAHSIVRGMRGNYTFAASQTLRRARAGKALTGAAKGSGRPPATEQHLVAVMVSVEAYMGSGLRLEQALDRAADKWGYSFGRVKDIYKKEAKLPLGGSKMLRNFFHGIKAEEIDQFIERFRGSETGGE